MVRILTFILILTPVLFASLFNSRSFAQTIKTHSLVPVSGFGENKKIAFNAGLPFLNEECNGEVVLMTDFQFFLSNSEGNIIEPINFDENIKIWGQRDSNKIFVVNPYPAFMSLRIYDMKGVEILNRNVAPGLNSLDVSGDSSGLYNVICFYGNKIKNITKIKL